MAFQYPDVMNDITDARLRFESGFVQYLAEFPPDPTPAGDVAQLTITLQNVIEAPVNVAVHLVLPSPRGRLRRLSQPLFEIFRTEIGLVLENSEVGQLTIPVHIRPHVPPGEYAFTIQVRSASEQQAGRTRADRGENRMGNFKIRHPQGLGIIQIASWGFETQKTPEQVVSLTVSEASEQPESVDTNPHFTSLWMPQDWELIPPARREMNERRIHVVPDLTAEALYVPLMEESQMRLADSGVQLHIGEAIFLTKILTYTITYMASKAEWQDCLLVPIYAYAQANEQPTDNVLWLVTQLGYAHVLELAIALSFSLVEEALQHELWDRVEQRALRDFIVNCLDMGGALPGEFLYLPLILGGIAVAQEIAFEGEDVQQSLRLLAKAKREKAALFADEELREINVAFDRLMAKQMR